jgi:hypothetical protein
VERECSYIAAGGAWCFSHLWNSHDGEWRIFEFPYCYPRSFHFIHIQSISSLLQYVKGHERNCSRMTLLATSHFRALCAVFQRKAKFSRRADIFAARVIFLELLTLQKPNTLYDDLYPGILKVKLPAALLTCFARSLDSDPEKRMQFSDLLHLLGMTNEFDDAAADLQLLMPDTILFTSHCFLNLEPFNLDPQRLSIDHIIPIPNNIPCILNLIII